MPKGREAMKPRVIVEYDLPPGDRVALREQEECHSGGRSRLPRPALNKTEIAARRRIGRQVAIKILKERADAKAIELAPIIADIRASGVSSMNGIARELNKRGITTNRRGKW